MKLEKVAVGSHECVWRVCIVDIQPTSKSCETSLFSHHYVSNTIWQLCVFRVDGERNVVDIYCKRRGQRCLLSALPRQLPGAASAGAGESLRPAAAGPGE